MRKLIVALIVAVAVSANAAVIRIENASGPAGGTVSVRVSLDTQGQEIAAAQLDIGALPIRRTSGRPDCTANPDINKSSTGFQYFPEGCTGDECQTVRVIVLALDNVDPIPNGSVMFTCRYQIPQSGTVALPCSRSVASDPAGTAVSTTCTSGVISIPTEIPTRTPTPIPACVADCDGDEQVTIDELVAAVSIGLGTLPASRCPEADRDVNGRVTVEELVDAVIEALYGCGIDPPAQPPTATRTRTPPPTATNTPRPPVCQKSFTDTFTDYLCAFTGPFNSRCPDTLATEFVRVGPDLFVRMPNVDPALEFEATVVDATHATLRSRTLGTNIRFINGTVQLIDGGRLLRVEFAPDSFVTIDFCYLAFYEGMFTGTVPAPPTPTITLTPSKTPTVTPTPRDLCRACDYNDIYGPGGSFDDCFGDCKDDCGADCIRECDGDEFCVRRCSDDCDYPCEDQCDGCSTNNGCAICDDDCEQPGSSRCAPYDDVVRCVDGYYEK